MKNPKEPALLQDYTKFDIEKRIKRINKNFRIKSNFIALLQKIPEDDILYYKSDDFTRSKSEGANPPPQTPSNQLRNSNIASYERVCQDANHLEKMGSRFNRK